MGCAIETPGRVFKNGSATLLARVVGYGGTPLVTADISQIEYSIYRLDPDDADRAEPVMGHTAVPLVVADVLYGALETDATWDVDAVGYNFKHTIDVSASAAFAVAGALYRVEYVFTPLIGQPLRLRWRLHAL